VAEALARVVTEHLRLPANLSAGLGVCLALAFPVAELLAGVQPRVTASLVTRELK
jgi:hypothetical protein